MRKDIFFSLKFSLQFKKIGDQEIELNEYIISHFTPKLGSR